MLRKKLGGDLDRNDEDGFHFRRSARGLRGSSRECSPAAFWIDIHSRDYNGSCNAYFEKVESEATATQRFGSKPVVPGKPVAIVRRPLQNQDNVIHVRARRIEPLSYAVTAAASHDFH